MTLRELFEVEYRDEPFLLDRADLVTRDDIALAVPAAERLQRWLGARRVLLRHALPLVARVAAQPGREPRRPVAILDAGTGGGDLARALVEACRRRGLRAVVHAIDRHRDVIELARARSSGHAEIAYAVQDVFALGADAPPESFDLVLASHLCGALAPERCLALLHLLGRLARHGLVVTDLLRHPLPLLAARALGACSPSALFRHDAEVAVRRAFTLEEWADIARRTRLPGLTLRVHFPPRIAVTWERLVVAERAPVADPAEARPLAAVLPLTPAI